MLAEATSDVSSLQFGVWMLCAFTAMSGLGTLILLVKYFRNDSEKREVSISPDLMTKADFQKYADWNQHEHENIFKKLGGVERGARADLDRAISSGNESREKLHNRINELLQAIARLEGEMRK